MTAVHSRWPRMDRLYAAWYWFLIREAGANIKLLKTYQNTDPMHCHLINVNFFRCLRDVSAWHGSEISNKVTLRCQFAVMPRLSYRKSYVPCCSWNLCALGYMGVDLSWLRTGVYVKADIIGKLPIKGGVSIAPAEGKVTIKLEPPTEARVHSVIKISPWPIASFFAIVWILKKNMRRLDIIYLYTLCRRISTVICSMSRLQSWLHNTNLFNFLFKIIPKFFEKVNVH